MIGRPSRPRSSSRRTHRRRPVAARLLVAAPVADPDPDRGRERTPAPTPAVLDHGDDRRGATSSMAADPNRRELLRRAGLAAAGAVGAAVATSAVTAAPAGADTGSTMISGHVNRAESSTEIYYDSAVELDHNSVLLVDDSSSLPPLFDSSAIAGVATTTTKVGVVGLGTTGFGIGVKGVAATPKGRGVVADNPGGAALNLVPSGADPRTRASLSPRAGDLHCDQDANIWAHTGTAFRKVAGPATAGSLHVLPSTTRIYDSRLAGGRFATHEQRVIAGNAGGGAPIPPGATAAMVNLTATNTNPGGFFAVFSAAVAWSGSSSVNWAVPNTTVANMAVVAVDSLARFSARMEGAGGADLVVDVIGYYA